MKNSSLRNLNFVIKSDMMLEKLINNLKRVSRMRTMKKLFSKITTRLSKIQQWWMSKDTRQKFSFHSGINLFLPFIMLFSMTLSSPVPQFIVASMVIANSTAIIVLYSKLQKEEEKELDDQIHEQKLKKTKDLIAKDQESSKTSYDKDTQEALQSLFETDKNNVDEIKKEKASKPSYTPHQEFNELFNKSNA